MLVDRVGKVGNNLGMMPRSRLVQPTARFCIGHAPGQLEPAAGWRLHLETQCVAEESENSKDKYGSLELFKGDVGLSGTEAVCGGRTK